MSSCKNRKPGYSGWICLCPLAGRGYSARQVLAQTFINGWLSREDVRAANKLAADPSSTEQQCEERLADLEEEVNHVYGMWEATQ